MQQEKHNRQDQQMEIQKNLEINLYVFMKECTLVIDAWEVEVSNWRLLWPFGFLRETMFSLTPTFDAFKN